MSRTEEHIDNPYGLPRWDETGSRARCRLDPATVEVNPTSWLKRHIDTNLSSGGVARPSAIDHVARRLRAAVAAGPTPRGRMLFGAALHTLEDYYAHSNFVELALIQLGMIECGLGPGRSDYRPSLTG